MALRAIGIVLRTVHAVGNRTIVTAKAIYAILARYAGLAFCVICEELVVLEAEVAL